MSSVYLRLLIFPPVIRVPPCCCLCHNLTFILHYLVDSLALSTKYGTKFQEISDFPGSRQAHFSGQFWLSGPSARYFLSLGSQPHSLCKQLPLYRSGATHSHVPTTEGKSVWSSLSFISTTFRELGNGKRKAGSQRQFWNLHCEFINKIFF